MRLLLLLFGSILVESFNLNSHSRNRFPTKYPPDACCDITPPSRSSSSLFISTANMNSDAIDALKNEIQMEISTTKRGLSANQLKREEIENLIQRLESMCPLAEPARSSLMGGKWIVDYTTSPPPSNGKLGPFVGYARQIIDLDRGTYVNYLSIPGEIEKEWLSATLEATFSEWDGTFLKDDRIADDYDEATSSPSSKVQKNEKPDNIFSSLQDLFASKSKKVGKEDKLDYGADSWKVNFETLTIKAFGIPLITKKFENTSRIWKMSYLDEETRIVRAGRTGKDEDNMVFYMTREE